MYAYVFKKKFNPLRDLCQYMDTDHSESVVNIANIRTAKGPEVGELFLILR